MDQLSELKAFCREVEAGSFLAAAVNAQAQADYIEGGFDVNSRLARGMSDSMAAVRKPASIQVAVLPCLKSQLPVLPGDPVRSRDLDAAYPQGHHGFATVRTFTESSADACPRPAWR